MPNAPFYTQELEIGPFPEPLTRSQQHAIERFREKAFQHGWTITLTWRGDTIVGARATGHLSLASLQKQHAS